VEVYFDNSATTKVAPEVLDEMLPYFSDRYGNPSSLHRVGREAAEAVELARQRVAALINGEPENIVFTSGGTESDNLAIRGCAHLLRKKGRHIITSAIEHPAVLETCRDLERDGFEVTYLDVDSEGIVSVGDLERALRDDTILVSIMHANNEIGTVQPVADIGRLCSERGIAFHTDAVQSVGKVPVDVKAMNIDFLSISGHKIHGPKGVGVLYAGKGLKPVITGGGHERGRRSGTENVPGIVGIGMACQLARSDLEDNAERMRRLRDRLIDGVTSIEMTYLNGSRTRRLPNNVNVRFLGIEGEALVLSLSDRGIYASTGSACSSKKLRPSHVLLALGMKEWEAHGSLRLTLSRYSTEEEVDYALENIPDVVARLREMSPVWARIREGGRDVL